MAKTLTEASTFDSTVTVPEGGDARTAASVETGFQNVANRTRFLKDQADAGPVGWWMQSLAAIQADSPGWSWDTGNGYWEYDNTVGNAKVRFGLDRLPRTNSGYKVDQVRILCFLGATALTTYPQLEVFRKRNNNTPVSLGTDAGAAGDLNSFFYLTVSGLSEVLNNDAFDDAAAANVRDELYIEVRGGYTESNSVKLYAIGAHVATV